MVNNAERLTNLLSRIRSTRKTFISRIEGLSQKQFDFKPSQDEWSIGEVVHHIALTEQFMQRTVNELLERPGNGAIKSIEFEELPMGPRVIPPNILRWSAVRAPLTLMMSMMPGFVKSFILANPILRIRTAPAVEPKTDLPRQELLDLLDQVRADTLALIEPLGDTDLSRYQWQYYFVGTRDVYATVEMLADHDQRHLSQIERVKRVCSFPV